MTTGKSENEEVNAVCLHCGTYMPYSYSRAKAWVQSHFCFTNPNGSKGTPYILNMTFPIRDDEYDLIDGMRVRCGVTMLELMADVGRRQS